MTQEAQLEEAKKRVGEMVKRLREERNWSQVQLGAMIGVDGGRISRIESGAYNIQLETLVRLANAFGVALDIQFIRL